MRTLVENSFYFGLTLSVGSYMIGCLARRRWNVALMNPLLIAVTLVIALLFFSGIPYASYDQSAKYLSYFLTPATVCLAIPLYKQTKMLKRHALAIACGICAGVAANAVSIFVMAKRLDVGHTVYVTLLPKSITTAIGMGVSQEAGGIVTITVVAIIITGILGNIIAEPLIKLCGIKSPVAKGLAVGTGAHAIGTVKALEMGEVEGAMSSLAIAVSGLATVIIVPLAAGLY